MRLSFLTVKIISRGSSVSNLKSTHCSILLNIIKDTWLPLEKCYIAEMEKPYCCLKVRQSQGRLFSLPPVISYIFVICIYAKLKMIQIRNTQQRKQGRALAASCPFSLRSSHTTHICQTKNYTNKMTQKMKVGKSSGCKPHHRTSGSLQLLRSVCIILSCSSRESRESFSPRELFYLARRENYFILLVERIILSCEECCS